jgi:hypothetical protein
VKRAGLIVALALVLGGAGVVVAHHAAAGIVDDDIYAMIDDIVADTPHGDMVLTDLGGGMTEIVITNVTVKEVENMIEDGLLTYGGMLDGEVVAEIRFASMRNVEVSILQEE